MTLLILTILLFFFIESKAQIYGIYSPQMFLLTQPSAKSEAMGRISASLTGSAFTAFYNPASSSFLERISVEMSHAEVYDHLRGADYTFDTYMDGINLGKSGAFTIGILRSINKELRSRINFESSVLAGDVYTPNTSIYMLNYSYPVLNGLSAGININYFEDDYGDKMPKGFMIDLGLMKKFEEIDPDGSSNDVLMGLSVNNITNTMLWDSRYFSFYLPSIIRFGITYNERLSEKFSDLRLFEYQISAEYYDLLNSRYNTQFRFGTEVTIVEILKIRGGWYYEKLPDYGDESFWDMKSLEKFTYGLGIEVPVSKLFGLDVPLNIKFDHTFLKSPKYHSSQKIIKTTPVYSLIVNYGI